MEFGAATTTLPKKLSSDYSAAGRSAYDDVFSAPLKLRAPSLTARFKDYREIFDVGGGGGRSLGCGWQRLLRREEAKAQVGTHRDEEEEEETVAVTMAKERRGWEEEAAAT
ncbi:hypothetical protein PIB30_060206 [Stylosanthes scabra]|uniref:Uncharacterized protein n=1 Tax=Stylosanthes scabra TaxID=79078 RepID=A0ABU6QL41_9FABA|nr:hypothetical protein [Stylosanthes scabra]